MTKRNVVLVILFSILTLGIYSIYWLVATKNEMNRMGAQIPTAWILLAALIPIVGPLVVLWWEWKYCEGVELVSRKEMSGVVAFLLLFLLSVIGMAILQITFNKIAEQDGGQLPQAQAMY